jgi:proline iminopeptidase
MTLRDVDPQHRRTLYPAFDPYETGHLDVGEGHSLYWELSGNPTGKPVVFLHGGPGGGSSPEHRRQFNPDKYKILVFDQRGCGKSTPYASLEANTTWDLVEDIEKLRTQVAKVDKWQVFGGSWGSTLSITYAEKYPERVTELVLRGIFLFDQYEVDWLYKEGADSVYPEGWEEFVSIIPETERDDLVQAYRKRLTSDDQAVQLEAAKAWSKWEATTVTLLPNPHVVDEFTSPEKAIAIARIENHYMANGGWLGEGQLLKGAEKLRGIPGIIVQGRHDTCTPPKAAWSLKKAWPEVELNIIADGGHLYNEPGVLDGLIRATDKFAAS